MSTDMNITLHIDRLILNGVNISHRQRHLLQASVQTELARLLAEGGVSLGLVSGGALPLASVKGIQSANGDDPVQLGRQIVQSLYGGIGK